MRNVRLTWLAAFATLAVLLAGTPAVGQTWDEKTIVTISGPVQLPGRTLAAGKYVFKLHDSPGARHIVQVLSGDESQILTTLLAIPAERQQATEDTVITFAERASTSPPAVRYWFYPAKRIGHEFVYPREQAMQIARASNQPVQATASPMGTAEEMKTAEVTVVNPSDANAQSGQVAQAAPPPPAAPRADVPAAESTQTRAEPAAAGASDNQAEPRELPQTAGPLPLIAALGLLSLGGALATRTLRRRSR
jgi:hypothetical protein